MFESSFFVPVLKSLDVQSNEWIFEGIASTSGIDLVGDVIYPESFQKSLDHFKQFGRIFYNHNYARAEGTVPEESQTPIGRILDVSLTKEGLYIKAILNQEHFLSKKIWKEIFSNPDKNFKDSIGLSIGAKPLGPVRKTFSREHNKYINILPELVLYEVSLTTTPVNTETRTWASLIKSFDVATITKNGEKMKETISTKPTEFTFNKGAEHFVIKSVIQNKAGEDVEVEQFISKQDFLKAFGKPDEKEKPEAEGAPGTPPAPPAEEKPEGEAPPEQAPDGLPGETPPVEGEMPPEAAPGAPGAPGALGGEAPPALDGAALGAAPAGMPGMDPAAGGGMPGGDPAASGMPGGDVGAGMPGGDPAAGGQDQSAVNAMILDKLDILLDNAAENAQKDSLESQNAAVETDSTPPDMAESPMLKSFSILMDAKIKNLEAIFDSKIAALQGGSVTKSFTVVQPPVTLSVNIPTEGNVMKSFEGKEIDIPVMKGFIDRYSKIKDFGASGAQKRSFIKEEAKDKFGISDAEFGFYLKRFRN